MDASNYEVTDNGCWQWLLFLDRFGYPYKRLKNPRRWKLAHRHYYELVNGPIPKGLVLDHLCRNRGCVNPSHLEAVTQRENVLRGKGVTAANANKTHCLRGHEFSDENTHYAPKGGRVCKACWAVNKEKYK